MQIDEEKEIVKVAQFLAATSGFIKEIVKAILQTAGCEITVQGDGLNLCYEIQYNGKKACLFFQNLYLDIATKDREAEPPEFDGKLADLNYFLAKVRNATHSRLKTILTLLKADDTDRAIEDILKNFDGGRIFIQKLSKSSNN